MTLMHRESGDNGSSPMFMLEKNFQGKRFLIPATVYPLAPEHRPVCNVLSVSASILTFSLALLISPSESLRARMRGL